MARLRIAAVIPARMGSTRFPGKPLIPILGLPMIEHVRRRVELMRGLIEGLDEVIVATCDEEIRVLVERSGGNAIMTSPTHERATDRIEEVAHKIHADVYLNVQGDEPMVREGQIRALVEPFHGDDSVQTTCLVYPIRDLADLTSLNVVKTVQSRTGKILYLSRSAIPGRAVSPDTLYTKQSGLMAFRKEFLHLYRRLEPTPLEAKESVDMLRVLEHDYSIQGVLYPEETLGVDIPEQVGILERAIEGDPGQKAIFESIKGMK